MRICAASFTSLDVNTGGLAHKRSKKYLSHQYPNKQSIAPSQYNTGKPVEYNKMQKNTPQCCAKRKDMSKSTSVNNLSNDSCCVSPFHERSRFPRTLR